MLYKVWEEQCTQTFIGAYSQMYNTIQKCFQFPEAAKRKVAASITRPFTYENFPTESHIELEWDNLVILDACRYDTFCEKNPFDTEVIKAVSNSSHTTGFLQKNFLEDYRDTVYVSASPQLVGSESSFHKVIHVWKNGWNDEYRTVLPEKVTKTALSIHDSHPDKRLVVHYMQPHYPFIGPTGRSLTPHATFTGGMREREHLSVWEMLSSGKISKEAVQNAYEENLEIVLEDVVELSSKIDGKTVVTSDHGNLFGEKVSPIPIDIYGHPPNLPARGLIEVPLVELPFDSRRETSSIPQNGNKETVADVEGQLKDLGYL